MASLTERIKNLFKIKSFQKLNGDQDATASKLHSRLIVFIALSFSLCFFFIISGIFEEILFKKYENFRYSWFLSTIELAQFSLFAFLEGFIRNHWTTPSFLDEISANDLKNFAAIALSMCASKGLTNMAYLHLTYPTIVLFKSLKLLTIMAVGVYLLNNRPSRREALSAAFLVLSCVLFTAGDVAAASGFSLVGVLVVALSLVGDAFHTNFQEKALRDKASVGNTMIFGNLMAAAMAYAVSCLNGEFLSAVRYCAARPEIYFLITSRSITIYFGAICFLLLIKHFGSVTAASVTTVRKIVSVILSFFVVSKPFTVMHLCAIVFFAVGLAVDLAGKWD